MKKYLFVFAALAFSIFSSVLYAQSTQNSNEDLLSGLSDMQPTDQTPKKETSTTDSRQVYFSINIYKLKVKKDFPADFDGAQVFSDLAQYDIGAEEIKKETEFYPVSINQGVAPDVSQYADVLSYPIAHQQVSNGSPWVYGMRFNPNPLPNMSPLDVEINHLDSLGSLTPRIKGTSIEMNYNFAVENTHFEGKKLVAQYQSMVFTAKLLDKSMLVVVITPRVYK